MPPLCTYPQLAASESYKMLCSEAAFQGTSESHVCFTFGLLKHLLGDFWKTHRCLLSLPSMPHNAMRVCACIRKWLVEQGQAWKKFNGGRKPGWSTILYKYKFNFLFSFLIAFLARNLSFSNMWLAIAKSRYTAYEDCSKLFFGAFMHNCFLQSHEESIQPPKLSDAHIVYVFIYSPDFETDFLNRQSYPWEKVVP